MKLDKILEFLFGKGAALLLLLAILLTLLLGTGCSDEDIARVCGDPDQVADDAAALFLCGCLSFETTCNIIACTGEKGCDAVSGGFYACGSVCDGIDDGAADACGSCFDSCDITECSSAVDCGSCISSCLGLKHTTYICNRCGEKFDNPKKAYVSYRDTYLDSCPHCGNTSIEVIE